jgi:hypothetical protein
MASKNENPASAGGAETGLDVLCLSAEDNRANTASDPVPQVGIDCASRQSFDYSALDPDVATKARSAANLIRASFRRQLDDVIAAGRQLQLVKDALEHGQFLAWLAAEFSFSERTAQRYMRSAEVYGHLSDTMSDLPIGTLYDLQAPSVPASCRDKIISRRQAGEPLGEREIKKEMALVRVLMKRERAANGGRRKERRLKPAARKKLRAERGANIAELLAEAARVEAQEKAATEKAVALILRQLGPDLGELRSYLEHANFRAVFEAVLKVPSAEERGSP